MAKKVKKEAKVTTPKGKAKKPVSKPKKVKEELPVEEVKLNKIQQWYGLQLDEIEKKEGLVSSLEIPYRMSSGLLCLDLVLGGGFASGWYSISGSEASAKSTEVMTLLGEAIKNNILTLYFDAEGAVDNKYTVNICKANTLGDIFGERNNKGEWERLPKARYYDENGLEVVFRTMKKLLLRIPEKRYRKDTGQWYLVFDKEGRGGNNKTMSSMGLTPDQGLLKKTGRFWCPVDDPSFQAIFILDSIPSLVPEDIGEEEEKGTQGIGLVARSLAQWVPQVRGLIRKKHVLVHVVNQLRDKPMAMFCFEYNAQVVTDQGNMPIGKIVNEKLPVKVLSYNFETNKHEYKKIIDYYDHGKLEKGELLRFRVSTGQINGNSGFKCTKNHQLYEYGKGFKRADEFKVGEYLQTYKTPLRFKEDSEQVLFGSILGDGSLTQQSAFSYKMRWGHCAKQIPYLDEKVRILGLALNSSRINDIGSKFVETKGFYSNKIKKYYNSIVDIKTLRCYSGVPEDVLNNIDLRGIAIWYQDDGSYYKSSFGNRGGYSEQLYIAAPRLLYNLNAAETLLSKLNSFGFNFRFRDGKYLLTDKKEIDIFCKSIAKYVHPCMSYKIKYEYRYLCGKYEWKPCLKSLKLTKVKAKIVSIEQKDLAYGLRNHKFDLQIEGNSNYFVGNCLVHNSKPTYEPGGNTIKFASDCRNEINSMSVSSAPGKNWDVGYNDDGSKSTQFGSEDSVEFEGGSDKYAYKKLVNTKNKKGTPFKKCWMRVWFEDGDGQPRGFDPVFDTYCYLLETGQVEGSRVKKFKINIKGFEDFEFDWYTFKTLILAEVTGNKDLVKEIKEELEVKKLPKLREFCFKQLQSGEASELIIKLRNGDNDEPDVDDDDDEDIEEF